MFLDILLARRKQGYQTMAYPDGPAPELPARFAGRPTIDPSKCAGCQFPCERECPTGALEKIGGSPRLDLGKCVFCRNCERICPKGSVIFGRDHRLAAAAREDLFITGNDQVVPPARNEAAVKLFAKSFSLRVISASGCGACEADTNVLNTLAWDLSRFGIHYAASPRHADGILVIGPVAANMAEAVRQTYEAVPDPKCVIAVGTCAVSGGVYAGLPESGNGCGTIVPVDLHIPGCPPHPLTILDGLLRFLGRVS